MKKAIFTIGILLGFMNSSFAQSAPQPTPTPTPTPTPGTTPTKYVDPAAPLGDAPSQVDGSGAISGSAGATTIATDQPADQLPDAEGKVMSEEEVKRLANPDPTPTPVPTPTPPIQDPKAHH